MASVASEIFKFNEKNLLSSCNSVLQELRSSGELCDIDIKVGDKTISAHRVILAMVIPYFNKTIRSISPQNGRKMEIVMKEMNAQVIESVINFCYTGKIEIERKNVGNLYICSNLFELNDIRDACVKFLTSNIQMDNAIKLRKFGESNKIDQLISAADKFISENFNEILTSRDFVNLKSSQLLELIGRDDLKVPKQEVYEAAIKWVKHSESKRSSMLPEILRKIQLVSLPTEYLVNVISKESLIRQSIECRDILEEIKDNQLMSITGKATSKPNNAQPTSESEAFYYISDLIESNLRIVLKYEDHKWSEVNRIQRDEKFTREYFTTVASTNKKIYVFDAFAIVLYTIAQCGMLYDFEVMSYMEVFDIEKCEWSTRKKMINQERSYFGVAALNDCIYVCGGSDSKFRSTSSVECFSESQNEWKNVAPLNQARFGHCTVSLNGFLYVMGGGIGDGKSFDSMEKYCPNANKWTFVKPMKTGRFSFNAATLSGKIYVCGGRNIDSELPVCEVYDPETNRWSSIAAMQEKRYRFSLVSCNGKLYATGGRNGQNDSSSVEEYCPENNEWKFVTPLPPLEASS